MKVSKSKDKGDFTNKFTLPLFYYRFRRQFFELFDNRCFKCGKYANWEMFPVSDTGMGGVFFQKELEIDHHIPFEKGGRLQAGNLVSLCKRCNNRKKISLPEDFYNDYELEIIEPYLIVQEDLIPKSKMLWSWDRLRDFRYGDVKKKRDILLEESISKELIECVLKYSCHVYYCGEITIQKILDISKEDSATFTTYRTETVHPQEEDFINFWD